MESVYQRCYDVLMHSDIEAKAQDVFALLADWREGRLSMDKVPVVSIAQPGRPDKPLLVQPKELNARGLGSAMGRASLLHSIAHIEFNAINLALDAAYRFQQMPRQFIDDWLKVASEEAYHFQLLREQMMRYGCDYGDFPAHNGLWETTHETDFDVLARMALVPRTLEARGLDVTPEMMRKLRAVGEVQAVAVLQILLRDEIGHVATGSYWFNWLCEQRQLDRFETFKQLIALHLKGRLKPPFNLAARQEAGFSEDELTWLITQTD